MNTQNQSLFQDSHYQLAKSQYDKEILVNSLNDIKHWHEVYSTGVAQALSSGNTNNGFTNISSALKCEIPEELTFLWQWHNGAHTDDAFIWYHEFLSVERALTEYKILIAEPLFQWQPNWIPVFQFQDEWYFFECSKEQLAASPVGYYFPENVTAQYAYTNLTKMMQTAATAFAKNAVIWTANGFMQEDIRQFAEIHQQFNTEADFPYAVD